MASLSAPDELRGFVQHIRQDPGLCPLVDRIYLTWDDGAPQVWTVLALVDWRREERLAELEARVSDGRLNAPRFHTIPPGGERLQQIAANGKLVYWA